MKLSIKSLTAPMALNSIVVGLLVASLSQATYAAEREPPRDSLNTNSTVTTHQAFDGFEIEIQAPSKVDPSLLLRDVPTKVAAAANGGLRTISTENTFKEVADAVDKVRNTQFRNIPVSLTITRTSTKAKTLSTSSYVDLYRAVYWWNRYANYGEAIYSYNYYVNTVSCFARNQYGIWRPAYQKSGSWYYPSYIYGGGVGAMTATGYDNYKGCYWQGLSNSNKGDFVIYMYN